MYFNGYEINEIPLLSAFHSHEGNIITSVDSIDNKYAFLTTDTFIDLEFLVNTFKNPTFVTDYVIEINGKTLYPLEVYNKEETKTENIIKYLTIPNEFSLSQNYPNPFNPVTKINFALPKQGLVTLKIFDILGREVKSLVNEVKTAGNYSVDFNASEFASGVYFYKLESGTFSEVKRMMLIK